MKVLHMIALSIYLIMCLAIYLSIYLSMFKANDKHSLIRHREYKHEGLTHDCTMCGLKYSRYYLIIYCFTDFYVRHFTNINCN